MGIDSLSALVLYPKTYRHVTVASGRLSRSITDGIAHDLGLYSVWRSAHISGNEAADRIQSHKTKVIQLLPHRAVLACRLCGDDVLYFLGSPKEIVVFFAGVLTVVYRLTLSWSKTTDGHDLVRTHGIISPDVGDGYSKVGALSGRRAGALPSPWLFRASLNSPQLCLGDC